MNTKTLIEFLLNSSTSNAVINDIYWNDVRLLLRLDADANSLGLPLYRDYSKYQYPTREFSGASPNSRISFLPNPTAGLPALPTASDIAMQSFCYIPNKFNHTLRVGELNTSDTTVTSIAPSYMEVMTSGVADLNLGTGDFTIEFSFFADEVNLPWKWQTLWLAGNGVLSVYDLNTSIPELKNYIQDHEFGGNYIAYPDASGSSILNGWGCFLRDNDLVFAGEGFTIKLNTSPIEKLTWYHICLQRTSGTLKVFINSNKTIEQAFTKALTATTPDNLSFNNKIRIGASPMYLGGTLAGQLFYTNNNWVDMSFSGGLTNFRITSNTRYPSNFYTVKLPFPVLAVDNKLDSFYSNTLWNLPFSYDYYNYSPNRSHFKNKEYLKGVPSFQTGFLAVNGFNSYQTNSVNTALSGTEWTIEFFICKTLNSVPFYETPYQYLALGEVEKSFAEWLADYRVKEVANADFLTSVNLISIRSDDKKVLDINLNFVINEAIGTYFAVKASTNGNDWVTFPFDEDINWNEGSFSGSSYLLPNNEVKFYPSYIYADISGLPQFTGTDAKKNIIPSGFNPTPKHIAISRFGNVLYILVDGQVIKSVPFSYSLYQYFNNLTLTICGDSFPEIIGSKNDGSSAKALGVAVKGVRVTNKARYSFSAVNDVHFLNSVQPLPLTSGAIPPARARVIDLVRTVTSPSISTATATWEVYLSQPVDELVLADFTLSATGITGHSISSLTKNSEYKYTVVANTGTGNGKLSLNFIDRNTVKYKGQNKLISYFVGELSIEGETYTVNKNAPVPLLSSGSNPYVNAPFTVRLTFDAAIQTFDPTKIGLVNARIARIRLIDEVNQIRDIDIEPVSEGVVTVQCMEGVGVTDSNIPSTKSASFVRIFSTSFAVLQTPLNIATTIYDISPSRIVLDDVIDNNVQYSNSVYPIGENSSLYVNPVLEQSGLRYLGFNAVSTPLNLSGQEWTVEFFLRINPSGRAHILSVENASTGFCVFVEFGQLKIQKSVTNSTNIIGNLTIDVLETPGFVDWNDTNYSQLQKYPQFAITFREGVYRVYRNGIRVGLVASSNLIDITKGDLYIGYYPNRIDDMDYWLSNVRFTLGKALYTSYAVNVPGLPYSVLPNITDVTELLNYISIYSNNETSNVAKTGDVITLKFNSIINLTIAPVVTILNRAAVLVKDTSTSYTATITVESTDADGNVPFSITISGEPNLPTKVFSSTTNTSSVTVDNNALQASITSDSPNNNYYIIEASITFTEPIRAFAVTDLSATNCKVGNLRQVENTNRYLFTITGIATGSLAVSLPANKVQDLAGNYNVISNVFTRNIVVPTYIPDPNFSNVLLLLQPTNSIVDESLFNIPLTVTNVTLSTNSAPQGMTKSLYFNGQDSSINLNLASTLLSTEAYTIEFFAYFQSNVVFKLPRPKSLPASNVTAKSFVANWEKITGATGYVVDVSKQANFISFVPGYRNVNTGDADSFSILPTKLDLSPKGKQARLKSRQGFVSEWSYAGDKLGFRYEVALDSNFTTKLYSHDSKFTALPYAVIGDVQNASLFEPTSTPDAPGSNDSLPYNPKSGVLLTGLLCNANYPRLFYFLEESTVRLYPKDGYALPAIAEDVDPLQWYHIAVVNDVKYTYLYVNGEQVDKVRNTGFGSQFDVGYSIGNFKGFMTGLRITKGIKRYTSKQYTVPTLPYAKN